MCSPDVPAPAAEELEPEECADSCRGKGFPRPVDPDRVEGGPRVVEVIWHGGMSEDRLRRLLNLIFGPLED